MTSLHGAMPVILPGMKLTAGKNIARFQRAGVSIRNEIQYTLTSWNMDVLKLCFKRRLTMPKLRTKRDEKKIACLFTENLN